MERVKKWCQAHQKACLITGIIGMLLSPFLWPLVFSSDCTESDTGPFQLQQVSIVTNI